MAGSVAAQPGAWVDPYGAFNFKLLINNVTNGHFTRLTGLGFEVQVNAYREAGNNSIVRYVPGHMTTSPVTLWWGVTASREAWDWVTSAATGNLSRRNVSIVLLGSTGASEVMRWNLLNAWPFKVDVEDLDALSHRVLLSRLMLTYEGLELESGSGGTQK